MAERTAQGLTAPDGRTLVYAEWGDPEGTPVLELHATPGCRLDRRADDDVARVAGVRLVTYDRPGYGGSARHRGRRVLECVADVTAIADATGIDRFAVLGTGGGGPYALAVAAALDDRVSRVVCAGAPAPYDAMGDEWYAGMDAAVARELGLALEGEERLAAALRREDSERRHSVLADAGDGGAQGRAAVHVDSHVVLEQTRQGVWGWVDDDLAMTLPWGFDPGAITVPVLVEYGLSGGFIPPSHGEWLARRIRGAEVKVHEPGGFDDLDAGLADRLAWLTAPRGV